jgi:Fur family peroxide stress response transcriptional regulator
MELDDGAVEKAMEKLRASGFKITPQRLEVFRVVARSSIHPSVAEVYEEVRCRIPTVSMDTVYRTLWTLSELGLVKPVSSSTDRVRFDSNLSLHHHFVCARCGAIGDFESPSLDALPVPDEALAFGSIWEAHVEVRGICNDCRSKGSEPDEEGD